MTNLLKILALATFAAFTIPETTATDKIVCYFGSWATYRNGNGKFSVENIDPNICTHIVYTFIGINSDGTCRILDTWNEIDLGALKRFNDLKIKNRSLKTLIAIGGWNEGSITFSKVATDPALRAKFAASAIEFMEKYGFDGFDLDWEYPAQRGGAATDKENFAKLLKTFREAFDKTGKKYLLTAAVAATGTAADISYDVPALNKYLDFINLMAYDFHGSYDGVTGQNAPMYPSSIDLTPYAKERCVDASVKAWIKRGASPAKIVLGMGVYGRTFTLTTPSNTGLGSPASNGGNQGPYTAETGMLGYNEICEFIKGGGWTQVFDDEQKVPYMYKGNQWVGYDNAKSIQIKVAYAKSMKLGGAMIWSIETDDFRGICGEKFPILSAINKAMGREIPKPDPEDPATPTTTTTTTTQGPPVIGVDCVKEGYMRDSGNCAVFYYCQKNGNSFIKSTFKCSGGLVYDLEKNACNYPSEVDC